MAACFCVVALPKLPRSRLDHLHSSKVMNSSHCQPLVSSPVANRVKPLNPYPNMVCSVKYSHQKTIHKCDIWARSHGDYRGLSHGHSMTLSAFFLGGVPVSAASLSRMPLKTLSVNKPPCLDWLTQYDASVLIERAGSCQYKHGCVTEPQLVQI